MKIRYIGAGQGVTVRVVGDWVWRPENGYECEVNDALSAANLMTLQGFDVAEDEPLVEMVGREHTFELALAGVGSMDDLAGLDEDGIVNAALVCGVSREEVSHWVDLAVTEVLSTRDHFARKWARDKMEDER